MTTDKFFIELASSELANLKAILNMLADQTGSTVERAVYEGLLETIGKQENRDWGAYFAKEAARRAGSVKSEAKTQAAREAGKLRGRPPNTERNKKIYELYQYRGYNPDELAEQFGITKEAVSKVLERIKNEMPDVLVPPTSENLENRPRKLTGIFDQAAIDYKMNSELTEFTAAIRGWLSQVTTMRAAANGPLDSRAFNQMRIDAYSQREQAAGILAYLKASDQKVALTPELKDLLLALREKIDSFIPLLDNKNLDEQVAIYCREIITNDKELQRLSEILEYFGFPGYPRFK